MVSLMSTDPGDLVIDPTCGSGTCAYAAEQLGRRWITIDTSRVALALARTRLMGARFPYYALADSPEGAMREAELTGVPPATSAHSHDVRQGFVCKRVPHIMLKSIANNPDIREGMSRVEIDAAIRRHADTELLCDQPYEDSSRIRVTGPFTVESLSPHRMLAGNDVGVAADCGVDLDARHALTDVGVVGDRLQHDVWHALADEALADVVRVGRGRRRNAGQLGLTHCALRRVRKRVVREASAHEAGACEGERHAARV